MSFALAAVVVVASFPSQVSSLVAAQKVEIIKPSKKAAPKAKTASPAELSPQPIVDRSTPSDPNQQNQQNQLDQAKAAQLDAKEKDLAQREAAVDEKEKAQADQDKSKAEKQKAQQKQIQKIGESNQKLWEKSVNALGGSTNE